MYGRFSNARRGSFSEDIPNRNASREERAPRTVKRAMVLSPQVLPRFCDYHQRPYLMHTPVSGCTVGRTTAPAQTKIYVGNVEPHITTEMIKTVFEPFGMVVGAEMVQDPSNPGNVSCSCAVRGKCCWTFHAGAVPSFSFSCVSGAVVVVGGHAVSWRCLRCSVISHPSDMVVVYLLLTCLLCFHQSHQMA